MKRIKVKKDELIISNSIEEALLKRALGYVVTETVEEFAMVENELKVVKRKVNTKTCPPDLEAIEMIIAEDKDTKGSEYSKYTDEELLEEKRNLSELFKKLKKGESDEKS